jgi:hypothetical protein
VANIGRPKGSPNKATKDVRAAIAVFAEANAEHMGEWLLAVDDPAKRLDLYLRALEYHIPKLARQEHTGKDGGPFVVNLATIDAGL